MIRKDERVAPPDPAALDRYATRICMLIPELAFPAVRAALEEVANTRKAVAQLGHHLEVADGLMESGNSAMPAALVRLAHQLHPLAPERIVLPACTHCGRAQPQLPTVVDSGRLCRGCARRAHLPQCATCGKNTSLRDEDGAWQCRGCRGRASHSVARAERGRAKQKCAQCGKHRWIMKRLDDGAGLCGSCSPYQPPKPPCVRCQRERAVHARTADGPVCVACHKRPERECGVCGSVGRLYRRERAGEPAVCVACYHKPKTHCELCGRLRTCAANRERGGASVCATCRAKKIECTRCGRTRALGANLPLGVVCDSCYTAIRRRITPCPACGDRQPLVATASDGTLICGPCAGREVDYACGRCRKVALKGAGGNLCYECATGDRIDVLLADYTGTDRDAITAALPAGRTGEAVWQYLAPGKPAAELIERLVGTGKPISHALLDAQPQDTTVHRLRAILMNGDVLPERADHLERLVPWLDEQLADQPAHIAHPVRTWMHWRVLRRARRRLATRPFTAAAAHFVRSQALATLRFLAWVDRCGLSLAGLTQGHLERWLTCDGGPSAPIIRDFLVFAADRGLAPELTVPERIASDPLTVLADDERWHHLHRALNEETLPLDLRALAGLILLYGIPFTRTRDLRTDDLEHRGDGLHLALDRHGGHRLRLAAPVADLLTRHLHSANAQITPGCWLFPGAMPGQPASEGLRARLSRHGFPNLARARAAALITLLEDVPPPVLASLLGLHPATAERWARYAQPDWSTYLDARTTTATPY